MEPSIALIRVAAMRRALAIPHQEDVWRRLSGLDLGVGNAREAHRGEESNGSELDRRANLHRASDPSAQGTGYGASATVHEPRPGEPEAGSGRDRGSQ